MARKNRLKALFFKTLTDGWSPEKLAASISIGLYIAFSPFFGAHTIMVFAAQWFFRLNLPVLFIATSINNPWTMIPVYSLGYFFGYWFIHSVLGLDPRWTISLVKLFGSGEICLWSFLIGGNIAGLIAGIISYPIFKIIFKKLSQTAHHNHTTKLGSYHEDNNHK